MAYSVPGHRRKVVVIGAGIMGLSTAVLVAENFVDVDVELVADKFSPDTTSNGAGGLWAPQFAFGLQASSLGKLRDWATKTWNHTQSIAMSRDASRAGVFHIPYYKFYHQRQDQAGHWWKDVVLDYRRLSDRERDVILPGSRDGYVFTSTVTDSTFYLPYLMERFRKANGRITKRKIGSLLQFAGKCDVLVNCSGLGAETLATDGSLHPTRGQTLQVEAPWIHYAVEVEPASSNSKYRFYFIPRRQEVVLGGTQQHQRSDLTVDQKDRDAILSEITRFMPSLKEAKIKKDWVGLRPNRSNGVRLEKESIRDGTREIQVVHNYGHSGNGITLHWGCALQASKLVQEILDSRGIWPSKL